MIIGMYPCIPFIARGLQNLNTKLLTFPLLFYLTYAFFTTDGFVLDLGFSGGVYGIYIVLGYCVKKGLLKSFGKYQLCIVSGMFTSFVILKQAYFCTHGGISMVWYDSGLLLMAALFLFEYISRIHIIGKQMWWNWLSRNSFGIYLVHYPFIMLLSNLLKRLPTIMPLKVALLWLIVLAISVIICWGIDHFPRLSKILLYNR